MSHRQRFVLEGEWTGYNSGQQRIVHRSIETIWIEAFKKIHTIGYTDGTRLNVRIRSARPREKVIEKHGYTSLLRDAAYLVHVGRHEGGFMSVTDIHAPRYKKEAE